MKQLKIRMGSVQFWQFQFRLIVHECNQVVAMASRDTTLLREGLFASCGSEGAKSLGCLGG
eukprot:4297845-Amphidinium_carterae.1